MNNYTSLYWMTRLPAIGTFLAVVGVIAIIAIGITFFIKSCELHYDSDYGEPEKNKAFHKIVKRVLPVALIMIFLSSLIPSRKDMMLIYAGGKTLDFVQSDSSINKIPSQATKVILNYLENTIEESKEKEGE